MTEKGINHVAFCMDSCRWDTFTLAKTPNFDSFTKYKQVYSHAGFTLPSLLSLFINVRWYNSQGTKLIPWLGNFIWVPKKLSEEGYYTALITQNPTLQLYSHIFSRGFDYYNVTWTGLVWAAHHLINETVEIFEKNEKPKFVFLLFMETHLPYLYPGVISDIETLMKPQIRSIKHQITSIEHLDKEFGKLIKKLEGTNTEITVFSDHGDLDIQIEGEQGHGTHLYHNKLFEIPLGRKTI